MKALDIHWSIFCEFGPANGEAWLLHMDAQHPDWQSGMLPVKPWPHSRYHPAFLADCRECLQVRVSELEEDLAQCYRISGAEPADHDNPDIARKWDSRRAGDAVKELRQDYDEQCKLANDAIDEAKRQYNSKQKIETLIIPLIETLGFYADPSTYFGIAFLSDDPAGEFMDDFSDTKLGHKPGSRARQAAGTIDQLVNPKP